MTLIRKLIPAILKKFNSHPFVGTNTYLINFLFSYASVQYVDLVQFFCILQKHITCNNGDNSGEKEKIKDRTKRKHDMKSDWSKILVLFQFDKIFKWIDIYNFKVFFYWSLDHNLNNLCNDSTFIGKHYSLKGILIS